MRRMRHPLLLCVCALIGFTVLCATGCRQKATTRNSSLQHYENTQYGFALDYPATWSKQESNSAMIPVMLLSPNEGTADKFNENINVVVEELKVAMSLEEYTRSSLQMLPMMNKFSKVEERDLPGPPAGKIIVYTWDLNGTQIKNCAAIFTKSMKSYVITCSAKPETYDQYKPQFEQVINSFNWK